jgi:uncharacterized protein YcaQ
LWAPARSVLRGKLVENKELTVSEQNRLREKLAQWMVEHRFATGHGDTFEDLLKELSWQVGEIRAKALFAANNRAGDAGNEAEKDSRLAVALTDLRYLIVNRVAQGYTVSDAELTAIIKECQG